MGRLGGSGPQRPAQRRSDLAKLGIGAGLGRGETRRRDHTAPQVVIEQVQGNLLQRPREVADLIERVDVVPAVLNHARHLADPALDPG